VLNSWLRYGNLCFDPQAFVRVAQDQVLKSLIKRNAGIRNNTQVTTDIVRKFGCHWETTSHYM